METLSLANDDLRALRLVAAGGAMPAGLGAGSVYRLPGFTAAEIAGFKARAAPIVTAELAARGAVDGGAAAVPAAGGLPDPAAVGVGPQPAYLSRMLFTGWRLRRQAATNMGTASWESTLQPQTVPRQCMLQLLGPVSLGPACRDSFDYLGVGITRQCNGPSRRVVALRLL